MKQGSRALKAAALLLALAFVLAACDAASSSAQTGTAAQPYVSPPMALAVYREEQAVGEEGVKIDVSSAAQGYVAAAAVNDARLKLQVLYGEITYTYDLPSNGEPIVVPLQSGDGLYTVRVMQNTTESKYIQLYSTQLEVKMDSEYEPFLRPNQVVMYDEQSACVAQAKELAAQATDDVGVVAAVYDYIKTHISYDYDKAQTVQSGYLPTPDETLESEKGICFDYAALAAAMLRSQGIPAQVITGYVSNGSVYHAWNRIYIATSGWITVEIKAPANRWQQVDLTFAAGGAQENPIDNADDYVQRYVY